MAARSPATKNAPLAGAETLTVASRPALCPGARPGQPAAPPSPLGPMGPVGPTAPASPVPGAPGSPADPAGPRGPSQPTTNKSRKEAQDRRAVMDSLVARRGPTPVT